MVAGARRVRAIESLREDADSFRATGLDRPQVGAKDDHQVGHVGVPVSAESLLRGYDPVDYPLATRRILELL